MSYEGKPNRDNLEIYLQEVKRIIGEIQYGSVTLVVQDGKIVQLERQEKVRLHDKKDIG